MYKRFLVGVFAVVALSGCVNMDTLSGDTYSADQAKRVQTVTYGTVMSARPVTIQGGSDENILGAAGGAILGGILGSTVGGGTGQTLATAAGAIAGGVAGQNVQAAMNNTSGVELELKQDNGEIIVVVQKQGKTPFSVGQRVRIAKSGSTYTVSRVNFHGLPAKAKQPFRLFITCRQLRLCNCTILLSSFLTISASVYNSSCVIPPRISHRVFQLPRPPHG